jgi:hypothetical protein
VCFRSNRLSHSRSDRCGAEREPAAIAEGFWARFERQVSGWLAAGLRRPGVYNKRHSSPATRPMESVAHHCKQTSLFQIYIPIDTFASKREARKHTAHANNAINRGVNCISNLTALRGRDALGVAEGKKIGRTLRASSWLTPPKGIPLTSKIESPGRRPTCSATLFSSTLEM